MRVGRTEVRFVRGGWKGFARVEEMVGELEYVCIGRWASADDGREGAARGGIAEGTREL